MSQSFIWLLQITSNIFITSASTIFTPISVGIQCFDSFDYTKSTIFNPPIAGTIMGVELNHVNGSFQCNNASSEPSNWGCYITKEKVQNNFKTFIMKITNHSQLSGITSYPTISTMNISSYLYPDQECACNINGYTGYEMAGITDPSSQSTLTLINPSYHISLNDSFMLQYSESYCQGTTQNIIGSVCSQVIFLYEFKYILVNQKLNWTAANNYCQNHYGTSLATIYNETDKHLAKFICRSSDDHESCWIYNNGTNEDCFEINNIYNEIWDDSNCSAEINFLCDYTPSATPTPSEVPISAPTMPPSAALTNIPTLSPTTCIDYKGINSHDGTDDEYTPNLTISTQDYFRHTQECIDRNLSECNLICYDDGECEYSKHIYTGNEFSKITQVCNTEACFQNNITLQPTNQFEISLICNGKYSCEYSRLHILNAQNNHKVLINVSCIETNACSNSIIQTDGAENISIILNMFEYSENIQIDHPTLEDITINCGSKYDHRYIQYQTDPVLDEETLLLKAGRKYESSNLPCQDVVIVGECEYEYTIFSNITINDTNAANCYWMDINQLFYAYCVATNSMQETKTKKKSVLVFVIIGVAFVILISILIINKYKRMNKRKEKIAKTINIGNPMVITISIGLYDDIENVSNPDIDGILLNLEGIQIDIANIIQLFGRHGLGYHVFPIYGTQNINEYNVHWTEHELLEFLQNQANKLESNLHHANMNRDVYDGLIVIISCHGMDNNYIVTSDYKKISKSAIHRIFSGNKPLSRKIPRIFIFDCCSGDKEQNSEMRSSEIEFGKGITERDTHHEYSKSTEVFDILREDTLIWANNEENPDYRLVLINAANEGFQSKMRTDTGSYVISEFCKRIRDNIRNNHNKKFLHEILDDIQEDLHSKGKQLMVKQFNNKTEWVKFVKKRRYDTKRNKLSLSLSFGRNNSNKSLELQHVNQNNYVLLSD